MARSSSVTAPARRRRPIMPVITPMLAVLSDLPKDPQNYAFEFKWDGVRALSYINGDDLVIHSRNLLEIQHRYPELHPLVDALEGRQAILDGEIVALDEFDRPSFKRLQFRMHATGTANIAQLSKKIPAIYLIFDLLYLDGKSLMDRPFVERRKLLEELTLSGPSWQVSPMHLSEGEAVLDAARESELEGVVAKRLDSPYEPGRRSPLWRKIKLVQRQEFVVGGWTNEKNTDGGLGAMMVGYYDAPGAKSAENPTRKLHFAGGVGSGFTNATRTQLLKLLREREQKENPFSEKMPKKSVRFVRPEMVIEVEFRRWPADGQVQQAAYKGLRMDKRAFDVVKERVIADCEVQDPD